MYDECTKACMYEKLKTHTNPSSGLDGTTQTCYWYSKHTHIGSCKHTLAHVWRVHEGMHVWKIENTHKSIIRAKWNNKLIIDSAKKWNESGFRPLLCTYRLNWARRTSWGWWDDWDDTVLQTQDSKFEPWRSEAEHATSRSRRLPTILTFTRGWGRNNFVSFKPPRPGTEPRTLAWKAAVLPTTLGPPPYRLSKHTHISLMHDECTKACMYEKLKNHKSFIRAR